MKKEFLKRLFILATVIFFAGCVAHKRYPTPGAFVDRSYVDLQPGWRIKVVTPILTGGGYKVQMEAVKAANGAVQMQTSSDFVGYEVDYYSADANGKGMTVRFLSAEQSFGLPPLRAAAAKNSPAVLASCASVALNEGAAGRSVCVSCRAASMVASLSLPDLFLV